MTTIYGLNSAVAELNLFVSAEKAHHKRRKSELLVGSEDMLLREMVKSVVPKIACQPSETTNYFISLGCMTCTRTEHSFRGRSLAVNVEPNNCFSSVLRFFNKLVCYSYQVNRVSPVPVDIKDHEMVQPCVSGVLITLKDSIVT